MKSKVIGQGKKIQMGKKDAIRLTLKWDEIRRIPNSGITLLYVVEDKGKFQAIALTDKENKKKVKLKGDEKSVEYLAELIATACAVDVDFNSSDEAINKHLLTAQNALNEVLVYLIKNKNPFEFITWLDMFPVQNEFTKRLIRNFVLELSIYLSQELPTK